MQVPKRRSEEARLNNQQADFHFTPAAIADMEVELERLQNRDQKVAVEEVVRTGAMGDFSENAGYQMAKTRLRGINTRILTLQDRLKRAIPIVATGKKDRAQIGSTVHVKKSSGEERTFTIVGSLEAEPAAGRISHTSPLGAALLNKKIGETLSIKTPGGETVYTVVDIS